MRRPSLALLTAALLTAGLLLLTLAACTETQTADDDVAASTDTAATDTAGLQTAPADTMPRDTMSTDTTATETTAQRAPADSARPPAAAGGPTTVAPDQYVTTDSGLKYYDLKQGRDPVPDQGDRVRVHYTGWLQQNGKKFDSSRDRGRPFTFPLGQGRVIKGWDEGVASMHVGGKRQLVIPPGLAYGQTGQGPIPPNSTLIFEVELLGIQGQ